MIIKFEEKPLTLGALLKIARIRFGDVSQETAAQCIGVSLETLQAFEDNKALPDLQHVARVARFCGLSVDSLLYKLNLDNDEYCNSFQLANAATVARVVDWITRYSVGGLHALEGKRPILSMSELEETFFNARHSRYKKAQLDSRFKVYLDEKSGVDVFKKDYSAISWLDLVNTIKGMKKSTAFSKEWGIFKGYHELFMIEGRIGESPSQVVARRFNVSSTIVKGIAARFPDNAGRAYEQRLFIDDC